MPVDIVPSTARPFAPRRPPILVLDKSTEVDADLDWLLGVLMRIKALETAHPSKKTFWSILSRQLHNKWKAFWDLCSLSLPLEATNVSQDDNHEKDEQNEKIDPALLTNPARTTIHIQGYMTFVDMVSGQDVGFKLSKLSILCLAKYHKHVFCRLPEAGIPDRKDRQDYIDALNGKFIREINGLQLRFDIHVLEGMGKRGTGELMQGRPATVAERIQALFVRFDHADFLQPPVLFEWDDDSRSDTSWDDLPIEDDEAHSEDGDGEDSTPFAFDDNGDQILTPTPPDYPPPQYPRTSLGYLHPPMYAPAIGVPNTGYEPGQMVWANPPSSSLWSNFPSQRSSQQD